MACQSLALLGPLQITLGGRAVSGFAYNKARTLLAYLAVEADRPHPREALVGLLWPELPDTAARINLRQVLANLRDAIGDAGATPPFLLITRDTIQFNPASDYDLDVADFTALLGACETHAHRGLERCRSCATRMEQAIARYRGDFLAEFSVGDSAPFEEWQLVGRERLHQRALDTLARLADYYERRGDDELARRHVQRQIALDPWREEAHRQLMRLLARGGQRSAALAQYETCRRILARDLGVAPEAATTALYERIRDGARAELPTPRHATPNVQNFPAQSTPLIGRTSELAELGALLENPACRLITVVGPGGIGKTRLALAAAIDQAETFADGAVFVPLQAIGEAAFVALAIMAALGVTLQGQREPREQLLDYLREKELLLVLDNFEQVIEAATLVGDLLAAAPHLTMLITSRSVLRLSSEHQYMVPALALPGERHMHDLTALARIPAVELFVQRSQMVKADFRVNEQNAAAVATICQRLDGLPLAIELAAARSKLFTPATLLVRLDQRLTLLTDGPRDLPTRQQTLRATLDWSYNLLEEVDKTLFAHLGVFLGGWTLAAAEAVLRTEGRGLSETSATSVLSPQSSVLNGLAALIDHSLVRQETSAHGENRFTMLETIREYALEQLELSGEAETARRRHAVYYLALAEAAEPHLRGAERQLWLAQLDAEHDNLRVALGWGLETKDRGLGESEQQDVPNRRSPVPTPQELALRLAGALREFWFARGYWSEGRRWLERALAHAEDPTIDAAQRAAIAGSPIPHGAPFVLHPLAAQAKALFGVGFLTSRMDFSARPAALLERSVALYREAGDKRGTVNALTWLSHVAEDQGEHSRAAALFAESLAVAHELGDTHLIAETLMMMGRALLVQGDPASAMTRYQEARALFREKADKWGITWALLWLGDAAQLQHDYDQATALLAECLVVNRELGDKRITAMVLCNQGDMAQYRGKYREALAPLKESLVLFRELGDKESMAASLAALAGVANGVGQPERAGRLCGAVKALLDQNDQFSDPADRAHYNHSIAAVRAQLDEATFAAAWAEGQAMTLEQAIAYALEGSEIDSVAPIAIAAAH